MLNKTESALIGIQKELHELNKTLSGMLNLLQEEDTDSPGVMLAIDAASLIKKKLEEEEDEDDELKEDLN